MSLVSEIPSIIVSLITLADHAYVYIISAFWYIAADYGMQPNYAFLQYEFSTDSFTSLFSLFTGFYAQIVAIAVLISSMFFLVENSLFESVAARNYAIRIALSVSLLIFSFDIIRGVLYAGNSLFTTIWNGTGVNWYSLSSVMNTHFSFLTNVTLTSTENAIVEFFLMSSLFIAVGTLFGVLMIREAVLLIVIIVLPFFSLLSLIPRLDSYTVRFWALFVQLSILPFFIIVPLYLASLFPSDFPLQLSLISAASIIPVMFVTSSRIFSIGSLYSLLDSFSFQRTLSDLPLPQYSDLLTGSTRGAGNATSSFDAVSPKGTVNWSKLYSKDFDYRRFGED